MTLKLYGMICGWFIADLGVFKEGASGVLKFPVPAYLIDHPKGLVLFDSGFRPGLSHPDDPVRAELAGFGVTIDYKPGEDLAGRMEALGYDLAKVRFLVTSHLHGDHVGGNSLAPNADWVIQAREWEVGANPELQVGQKLEPELYDLGHRKILLDGEHDLFGDGSVTCIPSYGHTPGHQSLRVRLPTREVVLTADACYFHQVMEDFAVPPRTLDRESMVKSIEMLRTLRDGGARLIFGHDPDNWGEATDGWMRIA